MKTSQKMMGSSLSITVDGHITGKSEVMKIKDIVDHNSEATVIELIVNDAYVIPSMLIGVLVREIQVNHKRVRLLCSQDELKTLIKDLNLDSIIEVS